MSVMYDIVCAYRIQYRVSCTISFVYVRYRMLTYDIVCKFGHCMLVSTSCVYIRCRMLYIRHCMSVLKAPSTDFKFSKEPCPRRVHMASVFAMHHFFRPCKQCWRVRNTVIFYIKNGYCHAPIGWPWDQWTVQTPSLGVREPSCTIPGAVECFYPDIHGARVGGLVSAMVETPWTVLCPSPV